LKPVPLGAAPTGAPYSPAVRFGPLLSSLTCLLQVSVYLRRQEDVSRRIPTTSSPISSSGSRGQAFPGVKIKIGLSPVSDVERVRLTRKILGASSRSASTGWRSRYRFGTRRASGSCS